MDLQLRDKVVVVTGGAKGIGSAIVRASAKEGAVPVIVDMDGQAGSQLRSELQSSGHSCGLVEADLTNVANCSAAIEQTVGQFGSLDVLVNNAGVNDGVGLEHESTQKFVGSLQRNLLHYYNMAHYAVRALKKSQGSIVNIASKTAFTGQGGTSGYVAAKGGILALSRVWAVELLPYGIRVNAVVPAEVMTPLYQ
jgi:L-fucose dehydrogenase